jgi:hypothetical protein
VHGDVKAKFIGRQEAFVTDVTAEVHLIVVTFKVELEVAILG